ncbi:MAG TPA: hypothetical protein VM821_04570 [Abditibacteriaceae bacterium]|nr:hypothetical protein [Abditibacteriaceae bacterium]
MNILDSTDVFPTKCKATGFVTYRPDTQIKDWLSMFSDSGDIVFEIVFR